MAYSLTNIEGIRREALKGKNLIFVKAASGKEGVILARKQGRTWWENAKSSDIRRVVVY